MLAWKKGQVSAECRLPEVLPEAATSVARTPTHAPSICAADLSDLHFMGTFCSSLIVMYCGRIRSFVCFDQHAVHERIRYEYYLERAREET